VEVESNLAVKTLILSVTAEAFTLFDVSPHRHDRRRPRVITRDDECPRATREIGMLRAVGMTRLQVRRMILDEAGIMGLIAASLV